MEVVVWMGRDQRLGRMYTYRGRSEAGKIYQSGPSIPPDFGGYGPPVTSLVLIFIAPLSLVQQ